MKRKGCFYWLFFGDIAFLYQFFNWLFIKPCIWSVKFFAWLLKAIAKVFSVIPSSKITNYDNMDGLEFEQEVARIVKRKGFKKVEVTKASHDYGVDIIAVKAGKRYAIQCKRYSSPVGISAIQEVYAGKEYYHCDIAVVITNNTFTSNAKELANKLGVVLWDKSFFK